MSGLKILYQSKDFVAIDKAAGISVHNEEGPENLLVTAGKQLGLAKLFPVHRLDKETSGVQILALNSQSAQKLAEEFQSRTVKKTYVGLLRGQLKQTEGIWNQPLTDKAEGRRNPEGLAAQRVPCETRYRVQKSSRYFSLCEFDLITGRQHQIRKHSAIAKHALVGDPRYGDQKYNAKIAELYNESRMFLHCSEIKILDQLIMSPVPEIFLKLS